jgi:small subunit ribosomal protein S16
MVKIRLARAGVRNKPFYRIVAVNHKAKKTAPALEILGHWQPSTKTIKIDKEKLAEWVKKGAQVSEAVTKLLK